VAVEPETRFVVPTQRLRATEFSIEGDHSSSSYLLAATAILRWYGFGIRRLRVESAQPDVRSSRILPSSVAESDTDGDGVVVEAQGRIPSFSWDFTDAPDLSSDGGGAGASFRRSLRTLGAIAPSVKESVSARPRLG
jgi:5-enolpyruvylshikimate-3-phosphate synthase